MLGSSLARIATEHEVEVLCIVRKDSSRLRSLPENASVIYADLDDYKMLDIAGTYDSFYHFAWDKTFGASRDDVDCQVWNIQYTLDAVRLAKRAGCSVFVGAGSQAEYGVTTFPLARETPVHPQSGYGIAKYTAGQLSKLLCDQLGMRFNWARIVSVFGVGDATHTLIMYAITELLKNNPLEFTPCEQMWDYLYCDDAARAFLAIGEHGVEGKEYPLGSGTARKLSEYIEIIRDMINPAGILQFGKKEYYPHQPMFLQADISELTADTGWKPEVSFEDGVVKILKNERK